MIFKIPNIERRPGIAGIVDGNAADARSLALAEEMGTGIAGLGCVLIPLCTGLSDARNAVIAQRSKVIVALKGSFGTVSEIALALKALTPVISPACPAYDAVGSGPRYISVETVREAPEAVRSVLART